MDLKSVSSLTYYVKDLDQTTKFYETLGFQFRNRQVNRTTAYLNWFTINFVAIDKEDKPEFQKEARAENKGAGLYINISVSDVDEFYQAMIKKGLKPSTEPRDWPWGNREFVMRDPDGYKLVFFKKK